MAHPIYSTHNLKTESPIERSLAGAILGWINHNDFQGVSLATQAPVGPYRADILIWAGGRQLIVECDGKEFHNSEGQVQRDKKRDRYCAARGIAVMRFSGKEIYADPRLCAAEVGVWIMRP